MGSPNPARSAPQEMLAKVYSEYPMPQQIGIPEP